jgi:hypothetical protein
MDTNTLDKRINHVKRNIFRSYIRSNIYSYVGYYNTSCAALVEQKVGYKLIIVKDNTLVTVINNKEL